MTTTDTDTPRTAAPPTPAKATAEGGPLSTWWSSWRVAARMARRELRRHRARSIVVALMVALPLVVIAYLATTVQSALTAGQPTVTRLMGTAAAVVAEPSGAQILQDGSHEYYTPVTRGTDGELVPATAIPGYDPARSPAQNSSAIAGLTGGVATPVAEPTVRVRLGERAVSMQSLAVDGTLDFGEKGVLLTGRWPVGTGEVLVTEPGIRKGLPRTGELEIVTPDGTTTATVTGTATGLTSWGLVPHLISSEPLPTPDGADRTVGRWLITEAAMPYVKVAELGRYGLQVQSAELMTNPVPQEQLPQELRQMNVSGSNELTFFIVTGAVILALVIALLVAPAFAVGAARQRHTLALAASNGATTRQLRHTVLAQALLLGVLSALVGVAVGVGVALLKAWWAARTATEVVLPLFDVPWVALAGLTLCAVVAAVAAALVPARRLGRLDIMGVLKGQNVSPPPSRLIPIVGALVMAASAVGLLVGARSPSGGDYVVAAAAIGLVLGALSLVPVALVGVGHAGALLPVPLRMATRDAARQRSRSAPSVAAVMGGVAALTIGLIAATSDARESEVTYRPQTVMGQGILRGYAPSELDAAALVVRSTAPQARLIPVTTVGGEGWAEPGQTGVPFVTLTAPGCTAAQTVEYTDACPAIGGPGSWWGSVLALPAEEIIARLDLDDDEAAQVRAGAAIVRADHVLRGDTALALTGTFATDELTGMPNELLATDEVPVPLLALPDTSSTWAGMLGDQAGALLAVETARQRAWPLATSAYLVDGADGSLTEFDAERIRERVENADFYVERGYVDTVGRFLLGLVAGVSFILLVVTLTSTALSMSEQRRDDATLAAVGATRGTRRAMAAAQALVTAGIGALLGLAVGLVPGIAFAYPLTRSTAPDGQPVGPFVTVPYMSLAVVVIGVPLVAALVSAIAVRQAPVVTRRTD
ncbi:FtsX-like permease family protein [Nostocoides sp. F2B08]|uniref:FtsX-like permease family protein n=1 Tax=Nostocoides sp. F2B08 TaxID=2653936 RepID=UPI0012630134|nr:FtsX-like permease family protein [Tetrasphaera sp. F2B08]KAB7740016.1 FtsX-like permease family protein [Tetrasphaera sp. F2B08]